MPPKKPPSKKSPPPPATPKASRPALLIRYKSQEEVDEVRKQATARGLTLNEYVIRTIAGRRADLKIEFEMILAVREAVAALRHLNGLYANTGQPPPIDQLSHTLDLCNKTIIALGRY